MNTLKSKTWQTKSAPQGLQKFNEKNKTITPFKLKRENSKIEKTRKHISLFQTLKYRTNPAHLISHLRCSTTTTRLRAKNMSRKGKEWSWYHRGGNKNVRYFEVWCNYCLLHAKAAIIRENPGLALIPGDDHGEKELLELGMCFPLSLSTPSLSLSLS